MTSGIVYTDIRPLADPAVFDAWYHVIPVWRQQTVDQLKGKEQRCHALGAGIALCGAMELRGLMPEQKDKVPVFGPDGKPSYDEEGFSFNLSHGGDYGICAFSDQPVGVDIERPRKLRGSLLRYICDEQEIRDLTEWLWAYDPFLQCGKDAFTGISIGENHDEEPETGAGEDHKTAQENAAAVRIWTMKESVMKYYGSGLALPARAIRLAPGRDGGRVTVSLSQEAAAKLPPEALTQDPPVLALGILDGHAVTVCSRESDFPLRMIPAGPSVSTSE